MKKLNSNLYRAKIAKKDEFYTQLIDIEKELKHYNRHFRDKVVYCNCDDFYKSKFFEYFVFNFNLLGLKKLIATHYIDSPIFDLNGLAEIEKPLKIEVNEVNDFIDFDNIELLLENDKNVVTPLVGDGDFRSDECIELLKQADIVVTNPPFSLFREYVAQLMEYDKCFLVIGDHNAITHKEIFKFIKENKIWLGWDNSGTKWFQVPMDYDIQTKSAIKIENNIKYFSRRNVIWYTNLDHSRRHEDLILYKTYNEAEYPTYDNYDAINVDKTKDIPMDYTGAMGVPITFMDKYNSEQFEILGIANNERWNGYKCYTVI